MLFSIFLEFRKGKFFKVNAFWVAKLFPNSETQNMQGSRPETILAKIYGAAEQRENEEKLNVFVLSFVLFLEASRQTPKKPPELSQNASKLVPEWFKMV